MFIVYFNMISLPLHLQEMAINSYDIVSTLQALGMMKYWKGKHIILKKQVSHQKLTAKPPEWCGFS